jgi:hypothetical protein
MPLFHRDLSSSDQYGDGGDNAAGQSQGHERRAVRHVD